MKNLLGITAILIAYTVSAQSPCTLSLDGDQIKGYCENQLFTGFKISLEKEYSEIDSLALFEMLPRDGALTIQSSTDLPVQFIITERAGYPQIMFKSSQVPRLGWYTFDDLKVENNQLRFTINLDPDVPVAEEDLEILLEARKLLSDASKWNREDDRRCEDDSESGTYSFFCALFTASTNVVGEYNHRNAVMQLMRKLIQKKYPEREWEHRFKDFNNMPETTFPDIVDIIDQAEAIIRERLKK